MSGVFIYDLVTFRSLFLIFYSYLLPFTALFLSISLLALILIYDLFYLFLSLIFYLFSSFKLPTQFFLLFISASSSSPLLLFFFRPLLPSLLLLNVLHTLPTLRYETQTYEEDAN